MLLLPLLLLAAFAAVVVAVAVVVVVTVVVSKVPRCTSNDFAETAVVGPVASDAFLSMDPVNAQPARPLVVAETAPETAIVASSAVASTG